MPSPPVITLLTDFGHQDEFVGVMKGVILSKLPQAAIIDLSHEINPQDILQGCYLLSAAYRYFPQNTVHTVVVDPGVGTQRRIIAVKTKKYTFLAPDNGVLSPILKNDLPEIIISVENDAFFLKPISRTFHGRDIFAPVAAYLAGGGEIQNLGHSLLPTELTLLHLPEPVTHADFLMGVITQIDHFGNLVTNFTAEHLKQHAQIPKLSIGDTVISIEKDYAAVQVGGILAVLGSRGYIEIAVNCGSAEVFFNAAVNMPVRMIG